MFCTVMSVLGCWSENTIKVKYLCLGQCENVFLCPSYSTCSSSLMIHELREHIFCTGKDELLLLFILLCTIQLRQGVSKYELHHHVMQWTSMFRKPTLQRSGDNRVQRIRYHAETLPVHEDATSILFLCVKQCHYVVLLPRLNSIVIVQMVRCVNPIVYAVSAAFMCI